MWVLFAAAFVGAEPRGPAPVDEAEVQRLVRLARTGDRAAANRLYAMHVARLYRVVRGLAQSDAEAEDIVQDAFVRALGALARYEPRAGHRFFGWLATIALNSARKRRARSGRLVLVGAAQDFAPRNAASDAAPDDERVALRQALCAALSELPERDRLVLVLRYGGELEAVEVARVVDTSEANVRKICERSRRAALARLRELLGEDAPAPAPAPEPAEEASS